jgi:hypothetical protein
LLCSIDSHIFVFFFPIVKIAPNGSFFFIRGPLAPASLSRENPGR